MNAAPNSTAPPSSHADAVPGLAARRLAADILDAVLRRRRALDDELDSAATRAALAGLPGARPRADAGAGRDRAAPARLAAPSPRSFPRSRPAEGGAAGRDRAPSRRGADSLARRARPRRRRSRGAAHSGGPPRRPLCRSGQCRVAAAGARGRRATGRARCRRARHAGMADGALDRDLRRDDRPRHRRRQ